MGLTVALTGLTLASCTPKHSQAKTAAESSPQFKQAQQIVQTCLSQHPVLSKADLTALENCIAPAGHGAAFQQCAEQGITTVLFSKSARQNWETVTLPQCVVSNR